MPGHDSKEDEGCRIHTHYYSLCERKQGASVQILASQLSHQKRASQPLASQAARNGQKQPDLARTRGAHRQEGGGK